MRWPRLGVTDPGCPHRHGARCSQGVALGSERVRPAALPTALPWDAPHRLGLSAGAAVFCPLVPFPPPSCGACSTGNHRPPSRCSVASDLGPVPSAGLGRVVYGAFRPGPGLSSKPWGGLNCLAASGSVSATPSMLG